MSKGTKRSEWLLFKGLVQLLVTVASTCQFEIRLYPYDLFRCCYFSRILKCVRTNKDDVYKKQLLHGWRIYQLLLCSSDICVLIWIFLAFQFSGMIKSIFQWLVICLKPIFYPSLPKSSLLSSIDMLLFYSKKILYSF